MNPSECFALLDDASTSDAPHARSRLYTVLTGVLRCDDAAQWPALLDDMQQALERGCYAVCAATYELGGHLLGVGAYPVDGALAQVLLFEHCQHLTPEQVGQWLAARTPGEAALAGIARIEASVDEAQFGAALARIRAYIEAGDTYQVNYTYRLRFDAFGTPCALYRRLRARQPVPYGALIALPDGTCLLSLSPELFIRHAQGELMARPMKGTAPASEDADENARRAVALAADPKNRAENLMIVDLLRNDLGRVADIGSVTTPALFEVQRYSGVLQMTSTVRARLGAEASLFQLFAALYPCGSITGAPKRRAMEIIGELEGTARGVYTGAIGWFDPPCAPGQRGDFCLSVPIRTLALAAPINGVRRGQMGVGAGIVYDSNARDEYAECQLKARFLTGLSNEFALFETMHATRGAGVRHLARHLARLAQSADYFGFAFDADAAHEAIAAACRALTGDGPHRLRLSLDQGGGFDLQMAQLADLKELTPPVRVLLADAATDSGALFLRHKTTQRTRYDRAWRDAEAHGAFDTLFFNQRGELTEGGRSNVFVKLDGRWLTPALACGLLPGVMRAVLLDDPAWAASEAVITREMLGAAQDVLVCNALRGALPARVVGDVTQRVPNC